MKRKHILTLLPLFLVTILLFSACMPGTPPTDNGEQGYKIYNGALFDDGGLNFPELLGGAKNELDIPFFQDEAFRYSSWVDETLPKRVTVTINGEEITGRYQNTYFSKGNHYDALLEYNNFVLRAKDNTIMHYYAKTKTYSAELDADAHQAELIAQAQDLIFELAGFRPDSPEYRVTVKNVDQKYYQAKFERFLQGICAGDVTVEFNDLGDILSYSSSLLDIPADYLHFDLDAIKQEIIAIYENVYAEIRDRFSKLEYIPKTPQLGVTATGEIYLIWSVEIRFYTESQEFHARDKTRVFYVFNQGSPNFIPTASQTNDQPPNK